MGDKSCLKAIRLVLQQQQLGRSSFHQLKENVVHHHSSFYINGRKLGRTGKHIAITYVRAERAMSNASVEELKMESTLDLKYLKHLTEAMV